MKIEATLPVLVLAQDYHEFGVIQDHMRLLNRKIRVKELGCNGNYVGIVYMGRQPNKATIRKMLEAKGIDLPGYTTRPSPKVMWIDGPEPETDDLNW